MPPTDALKRGWYWLLPAALAAALELLAPGYAGGDQRIFVAAGRSLLSAHWSRAFADPAIQVGPLQLALFGTVGRVPVALALCLGVGAVLLVLSTLRAVGIRDARTLTLTAVVAVGAGFTLAGFASGHPADSLVPLLWIRAGVEARRSHVVRAGLLLGLAAGIETWAILGIATLILAPRGREAARGAVTALVAAAALFGPFVLAGHFAMGAYRWHVSSHSLLAFVVVRGTAVGWPFRLAQGASSLVAGAVVGWCTRHSRHAPWLVALTVACARLLLDPVNLDYYFAALEGPALVGAALLITGRSTVGRALERLKPSLLAADR